ncbi:hypothetical protein U1769_14160 [Sphingomonas sp. ZT3P38]|uniref:hypothetical protein n=1 Tax=Parasphingomonas zepuensis TaxID=3096161 RepID=UPI002FC9AD69
MPKLLFATSLVRLRESIGDKADEAAELIRSGGATLLDFAPDKVSPAAVAAAAAGYEGLVLVGGYNVLPALRLDVLAPAIRTAIGHGGDPDDFLVWSDEPYADVNGNGLPDLPVTRIPDGGSGDLLMTQLTGTLAKSRFRRFGLRNSARPFADLVFTGIPGPEQILASAPTTSATLPVEQLDAAHLYMVLHGSSSDLASYWGESASGTIEALNCAQIGPIVGGVVFAASCYGALTVEERAHEIGDTEQPTIVAPAHSIALTFLAQGASSFVGCTGAHYSPAGAHISFGSHILHKAFWNSVCAGAPPARALFDAKVAFITAMPLTMDPGLTAVALKTWRQFNCLGLGW